jgi:putative membrane protein
MHELPNLCMYVPLRHGTHALVNRPRPHGSDVGALRATVPSFERSLSDQSGETVMSGFSRISDPRAVGTDPDYRFTLANERTFLAWIRTALALAAGGLGAINLIENFYGQEVIGLLLLGLSFATAATSFRRWAANERAMRLGVPLPASRLPLYLTLGTALLGLTAAALFIIGEV